MTNNNSWRISTLIFSHLVAIILLGSWLVEPTRSLWLNLDTQVFWALNDSLSWNDSWSRFWALANNRSVDILAAVSMLSLFGYQALLRDRQHFQKYIAIFLLAGFTAVIIMQIGKLLPIERPSGTKEFANAILLSEMYPEIPTKDDTGDSFPGDHGLVLIVVAGFVWYYLPKTLGVLAVFFAVLFTMPRLMSGAHWLTDEIVGAVSLALIALSWVFATPLHYLAINWLEKKLPKKKKVNTNGIQQ